MLLLYSKNETTIENLKTLIPLNQSLEKRLAHAGRFSFGEKRIYEILSKNNILPAMQAQSWCIRRKVDDRPNTEMQEMSEADYLSN